MKISDLKDAPQWLLDAKTDNADVEIIDGRVVWYGGTWYGGEWRGGEWRGGEWHGGTWLGGIWHGGTWYGGEWRRGTWGRGTWHSGTWFNGTWHGGTWRCGTWLDGTWFNGTWLDGEWRGERVVIPPMSVYGLRWPVHVSDARMQIGCQRHTHEQWENFTDTQIDGMHQDALSFWKAHRNVLLAMCKARRTAAAEKETK